MGYGGEIHAAILTSPVVMAAQERGCAAPLAVAVQRGSTYDIGQIVARIDTGVASLEDLLGKTFCRPDAASPTGWIFPGLLMRRAGIDPDHDLTTINTGSDFDAVRRVVSRECDAGGTYADARQALTGEILGLMEWTAVIARTEPIPHDTLAAASSQVTTDVRNALLGGFLTLDAAPEAGALMGVNQWEGFAPADESQFASLRASLRVAGGFDTYLSP
jgi:phosphonate transport system substrate-binding protein